MIADSIILLAAFIMFSGALGICIFPDSFQRFHAAGKVSIFGLAILILGEGLKYLEITGKFSFLSYFGVLLLLIVSPFASHVMARALYRSLKRQKP